jgi:hypothetical protein
MSHGRRTGFLPHLHNMHPALRQLKFEVVDSRYTRKNPRDWGDSSSTVLLRSSSRRAKAGSFAMLSPLLFVYPLLNNCRPSGLLCRSVLPLFRRTQHRNAWWITERELARSQKSTPLVMSKWARGGCSLCVRRERVYLHSVTQPSSLTL